MKVVAVLLAVVFVIMVVFEGDRVGEGTAVGGVEVCGGGGDSGSDGADVGTVVLFNACDTRVDGCVLEDWLLVG